MSKFSKVVTLSAIGAATILATFDAESERIVAAAGHATSGAYMSCFDRDYGKVTSNCTGGQTRFHVGVRTITGTRTFKATGCSSQGTTCAAIVDDFRGWVKNATGDHSLSGCAIPGESTTTLGTMAVGSTDAVHFECLLWGVSYHPNGFDNVGTLDY